MRRNCPDLPPTVLIFCQWGNSSRKMKSLARYLKTQIRNKCTWNKFHIMKIVKQCLERKTGSVLKCLWLRKESHHSSTEWFVLLSRHEETHFLSLHVLLADPIPFEELHFLGTLNVSLQVRKLIRTASIHSWF